MKFTLDLRHFKLVLLKSRNEEGEAKGIFVWQFLEGSSKRAIS